MSGSTTIQQLIHEIPFSKFLKYFNYDNIIQDYSYQKYINYQSRNELILYYPKGKDNLYIMSEKFRRINKVEFFFDHIYELNRSRIDDTLHQISIIEDHHPTRTITNDITENEIKTLFLDIQELKFYENEDFDIKMFSLDPFYRKVYYHATSGQPCLVFFKDKNIANLVYFNKNSFAYLYYDNDSYWTSDFDLTIATTPLIAFNPYNFNIFFRNHDPTRYISFVPHIHCNYSLLHKLDIFRKENNILKDYHLLLGNNHRELEGYINLSILHIRLHQKEEFTYFYKISGDNISFYVRDSIKDPNPLSILNLQSLILSGLKDYVDITNQDVNSDIYDSLGYKVESSIENLFILSFKLKYEYVINLIEKIYKYENIANPFKVIQINTFTKPSIPESEI
jgi:hypothetical protein